MNLSLCTALADLCPPFGRAGADKAVLNKCNTRRSMKEDESDTMFGGQPAEISHQTWYQSNSNTELSDWYEICMKIPQILNVCHKHHSSLTILLMEEILHQLIGSLSHYFQGFIHPRWLVGFLPSTRWLKTSKCIQMGTVLQGRTDMNRLKMWFSYSFRCSSCQTLMTNIKLELLYTCYHEFKIYSIEKCKFHRYVWLRRWLGRNSKRYSNITQLFTVPSTPPSQGPTNKNNQQTPNLVYPPWNYQQTPLKIGRAPKGKDRIPIDFQV